MNEGRHTPGPWHVGDGIRSCTTIYDKTNCRLANSFEGVIVSQFSDETCRANARLISAAPDLLAALQMIVQLNPELPMGCIEDAEAAIAKATGA